MKSIRFAIFSLLALAGVACGPPPKVLTQQTFIGPDNVYQERIQLSGQDPATKKPLFNFMVNICDVAENGTTSNCKETRVLDDVLPESL
ncbi:MAG: hypothetical protein IPM54_07620 [Polyangiaceae bacterium]|nr:hypothetical protein [Polyangiaceae bacterium]